MTDAYFILFKFKELSLLRQEVKTEFEKQSVYAATNTLAITCLENRTLTKDIKNKIILIKYHLSASLGYEYNHNISPEEHAKKALLLSEELDKNNIKLNKLKI